MELSWLKKKLRLNVVLNIAEKNVLALIVFNWPRVDDAAEYSSGDVGCSGRPHPQSGVFCDGVSGERLGRHSPGEEDDDMFLFRLVFVISALFSVCFSFLWYIFMYDFRLPLHRSSAWPKSYWILTTEQ